MYTQYNILFKDVQLTRVWSECLLLVCSVTEIMLFNIFIIIYCL